MTAETRRIVNALLDEAQRLGPNHFHRLGEELDGYDGPPAREVHRWVCLPASPTPLNVRTAAARRESAAYRDCLS